MADDSITYITADSGLTLPDRRGHLYVCGNSPVRDELLRMLALQDIYHGRGLLYLDLGGESAKELLSLVPPGRLPTKDICYLDLSDVARPPGINLVPRVAEEIRPVLAESTMAAFLSFWPDEWGSRMKTIFENSLPALLDMPGTSILAMYPLLMDARYRERVLTHVKNPMVRLFWQRDFLEWDTRYRQDGIAAVMHKVRQLTNNTYLRNILAAVRGTVDISFLMQRNKVVVVNLGQAILHDKARLVGNILLAHVLATRHQRTDASADFSVYLHDGHAYAADIVRELLRSTTHRVNVTVSSASRSELRDPLGDTIFGLCSSVVSFRPNGADLRALEAELGDLRYTTRKIMEWFQQGNGTEICGRLADGGGPGAPLYGNAFTLRDYTEAARHLKHGYAPAIQRYCRDRYGREQDVVEKKITRFLQRFEEVPKKQTTSTRPRKPLSKTNERRERDPSQPVVIKLKQWREERARKKTGV
jgi:hypothetical protein